MPRTEPTHAQSPLSKAILALLQEAASESTVHGFLQKSLSDVGRLLGYEYAVLIEHRKGQWQSIASSGAPRSLPEAAASDALDRGQIVEHAGWLIGPISSSTSSNLVFAAFRSQPAPIDDTQ